MTRIRLCRCIGAAIGWVIWMGLWSPCRAGMHGASPAAASPAGKEKPQPLRRPAPLGLGHSQVPANQGAEPPKPLLVVPNASEFGFLTNRVPNLSQAALVRLPTGKVQLAVASPATTANPEIVLDGTVGPAGAVQQVNGVYTITSDQGQVRGPNLFQSFSQFNLSAGETASFTGPRSIQNVLARVTGGSASNIDGTLQCTIPNANLYLINPAGLVFGPNAALNVRGSFAPTTANYVRLGTDESFSATSPSQSVLSAEAPAAFGFLGTKAPSGLTVDGANLQLYNGKPFVVACGPIQVEGGSLNSAAGRINIIALASGGEVAIKPDGTEDATNSSTMYGDVSLANAKLNVDGKSGGRIYISAGSLETESTSMSAGTTGASGGARIGLDVHGPLSVTQGGIAGDTSGLGSAGAVNIMAGDVTLDGGFIRARTSGTGNGGLVSVSAGSLQITNDGYMSAKTLGRGNAGNIDAHVNGPVVVSGSGSGLFATSSSAGNAGNISLFANSLQLLGGARINTTTSGRGRGGSLTVDVTGDAIISGEDSQGHASGVFAESDSSKSGGDAGNINFSAGSLTMDGGAEITSSTFGLGNGGYARMNVNGAVLISGEDNEGFDSGVFADSESKKAGGNAGNIIFSAGSLEQDGGGTIASSTFGLGNGGRVQVSVNGTAVISGANGKGSDSGIFANSNSSGVGGKAGDIIFWAGNLGEDDGGTIASNTSGLGNGGRVRVTVNGAAIISGEDSQGTDSGVYADSNSNGAGGKGGGVTFSSGSLQVNDGGQITSSTYGLGNGGTVRVKVRGSALISGADSQSSDSGVYADSESDGAGGKAGDIRFSAGSLQEADGGTIESLTNGIGNGGRVRVKVNGAAAISGEDSQGDDSGVYADSPADGPGGNAGDIGFSAISLQETGGGTIESITSGLGKGGRIRVSVTGATLISGEDSEGTDSGVFTNSESDGPGGKAGDITFLAGSLEEDSGGTIASGTFGLGNGGRIQVKVSGAAMVSGEDLKGTDSGIFADSNSSGAGGKAGNVIFLAGSLQEVGGGQIASGTFGLGNGGTVRVKVRGSALISGADSQSNDSGVYADSESDGAGGKAGDIIFLAGNLEEDSGGTIASNTFGRGNGGRVQVSVRDATIISGEDSKGTSSGIFANSDSNGTGGKAGEITFSAGSFQATGGGTISSTTYGLGGGGDVNVMVNANVLISGDDKEGFSSGVFANSQSSGRGGRAGDIAFAATNLQEVDGGVISSSTFGLGRGGDVQMNVYGDVMISGASNRGNDSGVYARSVAPGAGGNGGTIRLNTRSLQAEAGATISSSTFGLGRGGDVQIDVSRQALILGEDSVGNDSGVYARSASTGRGGNAGTIDFSAASLQLQSGGEINSSTLGSGRGGDVHVNLSHDAAISGAGSAGVRSGIYASASSTGHGGDASINAPILHLSDNGTLDTSTTGSGDAGRIQVSVGAVDVADGASIESRSTGLGTAGAIGVAASGSVLIDPGASISTSAPESSGGSIQIAGNSAIHLEQGNITTEARGDGGGITVVATGSLLLDASTINTQSSSHNGGNIELIPDSLALRHSSRISANAAQRGGNVSVFAAVKLQDGSVITATGSKGLSGRLEFDQSDSVLKNSLVPLSTTLEPPFAGLVPQCATEVGSDLSSFIVTGREGQPPEPGGLLPVIESADQPALPAQSPKSAKKPKSSR